MVSLSEFIAVIGVVIAAFGLGYRLGRDKRHDDKIHENSRPGLDILGG